MNDLITAVLNSIEDHAEWFFALLAIAIVAGLLAGVAWGQYDPGHGSLVGNDDWKQDCYQSSDSTWICPSFRQRMQRPRLQDLLALVEPLPPSTTPFWSWQTEIREKPILRRDGSACEGTDSIAWINYGRKQICIPAPEPVDVPAIPAGWSRCQTCPEGMACTTDCRMERVWTCADKRNVLWAAEDGTKWCHKVNR